MKNCLIYLTFSAGKILTDRQMTLAHREMMMISNIGKLQLWTDFLYKDYDKLLALTGGIGDVFYDLAIPAYRAWPLFDYGHCLPCGYLEM